MSLAERLNLHAPFRSFGDGNGFNDLNTSRLGHARKRRRSPSSASSFLESAVLLEKPQNESVNCKVSRSHKRRHQYEDLSSQSFSGSSQSSSETAMSPEKPTKTYERRSRHKTKEDRYELKQNKVMEKQKKQRKDKKKGEAKKEKKPRLCKKSGAALVHDFEAHNVAQDRLTVGFLCNTLNFVHCLLLI